MGPDLAAQLRQVQQSSGRSLRDLERAVHVSNSSLSRYLTGQTVPPWPVVVALCQVSGHDPRPLRPLWEQARRRSRSTTPSTVPPRRVSRNDLPHDIATFSGRKDELAALMSVIETKRIVAIDGMAGVGKTTFAVHAAHRLGAEFPDGQLYLDLHGFTPGREPTDAADALRVLLTAVGVASNAVPDDVEERAALWRAELAERRVLVVLDNASDAGHVRPLLPGAGASLTLITSRRRMVVLDGAYPLSLDVLPPDDAAALFADAVGDTRADSSPAVAEVLRRCGHLPLALSVAAARLRHRPAWTADALVERLGDTTAETSGVFAMSLRQLDPAQRRMFRLIGQVPGADIDPHAAAALAGVPFGNARSLLDNLVDAHLLQEPAPNRYSQHDLLREYARHAGTADATPDDGPEALTRLLGHQLHTAGAAVDLLFPFSRHLRPRTPEPYAPGVALADASEAIAWLDAERANLLAGGTYAADNGWPAHTTALAETIHPYLYDYGFHAEDLALQASAVQANRRRGDQPGEVRTLVGLAWVHLRQGRYGPAEENALAALEVCRDSADRVGAARTMNVLGNVCWRRSELQSAHDHFRRALELWRSLGERRGEAIVLGNIGIVHESQGHYDEAERYLRMALELYRECEERGLEPAIAMSHLGSVCRRLGSYEEARAQHRQALEVFREFGNQSEEADALNGLGEAARAMGEPARAVDDHAVALGIAREVRNRAQEARACEGLARAHQDRGQTDLARGHAERALRLYVELDTPEAEQMRHLVASLGSS